MKTYKPTTIFFETQNFFSSLFTRGRHSLLLRGCLKSQKKFEKAGKTRKLGDMNTTSYLADREYCPVEYTRTVDRFQILNRQT